MSQSQKVFQTRFDKAFLHPRYWGTWAVIALLVLFAYMPVGARDRFAGWVAGRLSNARLLRRRKRIAHANLKLCFPDLTEAQREALLLQNVRSFAQIMLSLAELMVRSKAFIQRRVQVNGWDNLAPYLEAGRNLVFLLPHSYGVDYAGIYLSSLGLSMSCMFKPTGNKVFDYLMSKQRRRFGGLVFERNSGFRTLVKATSAGHACFYLPDEDHGPKRSVFAPFFATHKATLPALGGLARLANATVIPMYVHYDDAAHRYELVIHPAMDPFPTGSAEGDAEAMNRQVEQLLEPRPEQYMWTLKLLKTRPEGESNPYK